MPIFAAVGGILGAIGAGAGVTGAGVTAGMSIAAGAGIVGSVAGLAGTAVSMVGSAQQAAAAKKALANSNIANTPDTTVDATTNSNLNNLGRAALISTSPQGVQGTDPIGRYRLLGN